MTNKREFPRELPVDMSFVDRQGNAVHPSREDYNTRNTKKLQRLAKRMHFLIVKHQKKI